MLQDLHLVTAQAGSLGYTVLAQAEKTGPQGPEFGKASPVGLLVIVALLVVILALGVLFNRRMKNMVRRREYAEKHAMDPFDIDGIDAAMARDQGLNDDEVEEQAWPLAEPEELAAQYGEGDEDPRGGRP
ncbi:hypothetical protein [uncultured Corynebacterium sp.]|uniref:hypothetical protein n=1 Tax=uncultured Corynebacterium sp. TaxID=159447 RepID=UPI0025D71ACE|nr:hypothetical protein [uncultured Corynebacterium sp.]